MPRKAQTMLCVTCGRKTMRTAFAKDFDLTPYAGLPATVTDMRIQRCSNCGAETVDGKDIGLMLDKLVVAVVQRHELTGEEARFLRKSLKLTQKEPADKSRSRRPKLAPAPRRRGAGR